MSILVLLPVRGGGGVFIGLSCNLQDHIKEGLMYLNALLTMV